MLIVGRCNPESAGRGLVLIAPVTRGDWRRKHQATELISAQKLLRKIHEQSGGAAIGPIGTGTAYGIMARFIKTLTIARDRLFYQTHRLRCVPGSSVVNVEQRCVY